MSSSRFNLIAQSACVIVVVGCSTTGHSADFICPSTLQTHQTASAPKSWTVLESVTPSALEGVSFFSGNPGEQASLVPDETHDTATRSTDRWKFVRSPGEQIWLGCSYRNTNVVLAQRVSGDLHECAAEFELTQSSHRLRLLAISCR